MGYTIEVNYFNSFWLKKVVQSGSKPQTLPQWPGLPWNPTGYPVFPFGGGTATPIIANQPPWFVEESRIKGGFNNTTVDFGVRAYVAEEETKQVRRGNSLIYSGVFNSSTNTNRTNVFSVGEVLTRSADPINGSIQKLHAEDTNLVVFQELKVNRALIDKDTIYTSEGGTQTQGGKIVIGQIIPYTGNWGISKNPESFAFYGYRKYFADKNQGVVLRLSKDGITEISGYGMKDYFRDHLNVLSDKWETLNNIFTLNPVPTGVAVTSFNVNSADGCGIEKGAKIQAVITTDGLVTTIYPEESYVTNVSGCGGGVCTVTIDPAIDFSGISPTDIILYTPNKGRIVGGFDVYDKNYVISLQSTPSYFNTPTRFSTINGSISGNYDTLNFDESVLGWVSFYTYKPTLINSLQNTFYSFNSGNVWRHNDELAGENRGEFYNTRSDAYIEFVFNPNPSITKNFLTTSYEGTNGWEISSFKSSVTGPDSLGSDWINTQDTVATIKSYNEGLYTQNGVPKRAGFDRKENRYVANLINNSNAASREVIFGNSMSGIKGYFATVKIQTDDTTQPGAMKELFSVGSSYSISSY